MSQLGQAYIVIRTASTETVADAIEMLVAMVNDRMQQGYVPQGGVNVSNGFSMHYAQQAMILDPRGPKQTAPGIKAWREIDIKGIAPDHVSGTFGETADTLVSPWNR